MSSDESNPRDFDRLLADMPKIAKVTNEFSSPEVQLRAFEALLHVHEQGGRPAYLDRHESVRGPAADIDTDDPPSIKPPVAVRKRASGASGKKDWTVTKGLNFAPIGAQSLLEFMKEKNPVNQNERNLAAAYYLTKVMEKASVSVGDVLAVYQTLSWPKPSNPSNSLQVTASTKGWLDTQDMNAISVIWAGSNHIEDKMPSKSGKS